jgi:3-deoxy-D-manno-octulosonate 8-phosphate phosphatase (KDO 8-P phosphatase)
VNRPPPAHRAVTPRLQFAPELLLAAQPVRIAVFDVDGCLTDGRIYIGEQGESFKAFSTLDGHGIKLLAAGGIRPVVITGRDSPAVRRRCADLGITEAVYGVHDKLAAACALLARLDLGWDELAVIGDDWPDLPLLTRCAFACAPADTPPPARAACTSTANRCLWRLCPLRWVRPSCQIRRWPPSRRGCGCALVW